MLLKIKVGWSIKPHHYFTVVIGAVRLLWMQVPSFTWRSKPGVSLDEACEVTEFMNDCCEKNVAAIGGGFLGDLGSLLCFG